MSTHRQRQGGFAPLEFLRRSVIVDDRDDAEAPLTPQDALTRDPDADQDRPFTERRRHSPLRVGIAAAVVAVLASVSVGGVMMASASSSAATNLNSLAVDTSRPDITRAVPQTDSTSLTDGLSSSTTNSRSKAAQSSRDARGSSVSRNSVRSQIDKAMSQTAAQQRNSNLATTTDEIQSNAASVSETARAKEMDASVAAVKKRAKQIAAEKKAAEERLAKAAAASGVKITPGTTAAITNDGGASMPVRPGSYTLGSYWGETGVWARWHTGEDFVAACGTPLYAVATGVVGQQVSASWAGNHVVIHLANGGSVLYAHMSSIGVTPGQIVKPGQLIGYSGETGRAFGCHLHFEYYPQGTTPGDVYSTTDPLVFLRSLGLKP